MSTVDARSLKGLPALVADLATKGVTAEPATQLGPGMWTSWLTDPDGYRIELVQWPPGHPAGMTVVLVLRQPCRMVYTGQPQRDALTRYSILAATGRW